MKAVLVLSLLAAVSLALDDFKLKESSPLHTLVRDFEVVYPQPLTTRYKEATVSKLLDASQHPAQAVFALRAPAAMFKASKEAVGEEDDAGDATLYLRLDKNEGLLAPHYSERVLGANGQVLSERSRAEVPHCFYHGVASSSDEHEADVSQRVAISTCNGLDGLVIVENEAGESELVVIHPAEQHVEDMPASKSYSRPHILYRWSDMDIPEDWHGCGLDSELEDRLELLNSLNEEDEAAPKQHFVSHRVADRGIDVYAANDNVRYDQAVSGSYDDELESRTTQRFNEMDLLYAHSTLEPHLTVSLTVRLVGQETWTTSQLLAEPEIIGSETNTTELLQEWSALIASYSHVDDIDNFHLLSGRDFLSGTIGLAYVGTMCSPDSTAVDQTVGLSTALLSATMAHELGHNLGMRHDGTESSGGSLPYNNTECSPSGDVMQAIVSGTPPTSWSTCSSTNFNDFYGSSRWSSITSLYGDCLVTDVNPVCGDGLVTESAGETCDCGGEPQINHPCCDCSTCRCRDDEFSCCSSVTCEIEDSGTVCQIHDTCDISGTCNGTSLECHSDLYVPPGTECTPTGSSSADGECYEGECVSIDSLCKDVNPAFSDDPSCSQTCGNLRCHNGASCVDAGVSAADGVACGSSSQCNGGSCTSSASLLEFSWLAGSYPPNGANPESCTRTVVCQRVVGGAVVDDAACVAADKPVACDDSQCTDAQLTCAEAEAAASGGEDDDDLLSMIGGAGMLMYAGAGLLVYCCLCIYAQYVCLSHGKPSWMSKIEGYEDEVDGKRVYVD